MAIKILLADDHPLFRRSIQSVFESEGYEQIDEVDSCENLLIKLKQGKYTHLVLDIFLADESSLEIVEDIRRQYPSLNILILSSQPSAVYATPIKQQYGIPYISKSEPEGKAIPRLLSFLGNKQPSATAGDLITENPFAALTTKELSNLHYLLLGWSNERIAAQLKVAASTVRTHKMNIHQKTKTSDLLELKRLAQIYKIE